MDSLVPVILNGVVIVLLCAAIVFGVRLHRRLVALQSAQSEFAALLGRLDGALVQASTTVSALKYNAARQLETTLPRPAATPAPTPRPAAAPAAASAIAHQAADTSSGRRRDDQDRPDQGRGGEAGAGPPPPLGRQPDRGRAGLPPPTS